MCFNSYIIYLDIDCKFTLYIHSRIHFFYFYFNFHRWKLRKMLIKANNCSFICVYLAYILKTEMWKVICLKMYSTSSSSSFSHWILGKLAMNFWLECHYMHFKKKKNVESLTQWNANVAFLCSMTLFMLFAFYIVKILEIVLMIYVVCKLSL